MVLALRQPWDLVDLAIERFGKIGTARLLHVSPGTITHWCTRRNKPSTVALFKLCEALGVSRDEVEV